MKKPEILHVCKDTQKELDDEIIKLVGQDYEVKWETYRRNSYTNIVLGGTEDYSVTLTKNMNIN